MHTGELTERRRLEVNVQRPRLANVGSAVGGEVEDLFLGDLSDGLVDCFDVIWDAGDILNRSVVRNDHVLHLIPKVEVDEFAKEPAADHLEFAGEDATR